LCGFPPFVSLDNEQEELFERILSGQYEFTSPYWDTISDSAKQLISNMLQAQPELRFSAEDVLDHPWLAVTVIIYNIVILSHKLEKSALPHLPPPAWLKIPFSLSHSNRRLILSVLGYTIHSLSHLLFWARYLQLPPARHVTSLHGKKFSEFISVTLWNFTTSFINKIILNFELIQFYYYSIHSKTFIISGKKTMSNYRLYKLFHELFKKLHITNIIIEMTI